MSTNLHESSKTLLRKPAANDHPIHDLLKDRWSPRAFNSQPVEMEKLTSLFEAARWSPSGGNSQPWGFVVVTQENGEAFARMVEALMERNQIWACQAPILVLTVTKREMLPGRDNPWASYDLGQAVAYLTFQASALGLMVHQIGGFDREKARQAFQIPAGYDPITVIAIGYQGDMSRLPEALRQREQESRTRKPQHEFVFEQNWNQPLTPPASQGGV